MMLEHNGRACSPKEFLTVGNWGEESKAGLCIKFPVMQSASGIRRVDSDTVAEFPVIFTMPLCSVFVLLLAVSPSHPLTLLFFFYMCIDIVLKGDTDGSFKKENHGLQEQVSRFKNQLQEAHDE